MEKKYYVVGANWSGEKKYDEFYRRGYWEMGYADKEKPDFASIRDDIRPGDRIAIKSMEGQGASTILIHALGIVKEVAEGRVYINWLVTRLNRHVDAHGCLSTIRGPFTLSEDKDKAWIQSVFCI